MDPFTVDITNKNMSVDLLMKTDGIYPAATQLFLPQGITFDAFSTYQYGDPSIIPDAQSDIGLPIEYTSSNNSIAAVENGKIIINGVGTVFITATQAGNTFYLPASTTRSLTVIKADQSVVLSSLPAKTYGDVPFSVESSSSADLVVNLSSSDPSVASVSGNMVTIHGAGIVKIIAEQPGNDFYNAAPPSQQLLTINKATQTISFDDLSEQNVDVGSFVLSANTNSGLDVTFESSDTEVVSIVGNVATVHKDGVVSITAHQLGNQNYLAADDVVRSQVINIVLGVELADLSKYIFPNPTTDFVFFQIPEVENIEVSDVMGRTRKDVVWIDGKIDFSHTEPGVYFVKLIFQNHTEITRVVKN
jgi:hypothetical protein